MSGEGGGEEEGGKVSWGRWEEGEGRSKGKFQWQNLKFESKT